MSRARPLNIRCFKTLRPPRVLIRDLKPWTRARRLFFGWYVLFGIIPFQPIDYTHCPKGVSI